MAYYKKETEVEKEVREYKIELERIIEEYELPENRSKWSVSNLMWLNHNLPMVARGRPNLKENRQFIVRMLRDRKRLMIP